MVTGHVQWGIVEDLDLEYGRDALFFSSCSLVSDSLQPQGL